MVSLGIRFRNFNFLGYSLVKQTGIGSLFRDPGYELFMVFPKVVGIQFATEGDISWKGQNKAASMDFKTL